MTPHKPGARFEGALLGQDPASQHRCRALALPQVSENDPTLSQGSMANKDINYTLEKEKEKIIEGLKSDEKSVSAIARRVENVLTFGKEHYKGEFTNEETLKNVTLDDVILNYNTYFVPANAYLVIVGDVNFKEVKKEVEKLEIHKIVDKNVTYEFYNSNNIKKMLKFNY